MMVADENIAPGSKRKAKHRTVYFVQAVELGLIKIGVAVDIQPRLRCLQGSSPDKLRILGVIRCNRHGATEKEVHQMFAHLRNHGEWFRPERELLEWIAGNAETQTREILLLQRIFDFPLSVGVTAASRRRENRIRQGYKLGRIHLPFTIAPLV